MSTRGRVVLIGMGETTLSALESLTSTLEVVGIVRQQGPPGAPEDPVSARAKALGIQQYSDVAPSAVADLASALRPDIIVVSSYNRIIKPELLERFKFVNVHYSPLPKYRGRANVNWALINDEEHTAITIHVIAPDLDAGNILFQHIERIRPDDTVGRLYERLNALQRENLGPTIVGYLSGDVGVPQVEEHASYGCSRLPTDGHISWAEPTRTICCLIRALGPPFPGAFTYLEGRKLVVWKAVPLNDARNYVGRIPGRVVSRSGTDGHVDVLTGDGVLRLLEVQLEGTSPTSAASVITSVRSSLGLDVQELLSRIRNLETQLAALGQHNTNGRKGSGP